MFLVLSSGHAEGHSGSRSLTGLLFVSVKLDPPSDLQSNVSSEHCVLTWSISFVLEPFITSLSYELAFKKQEEAWEVTWWLPGVCLLGLARAIGENRGGSELDTHVCAGYIRTYACVHACL